MEVRNTKRQCESPLDGEVRPDKDETAVHVLPGPGHTGPQDQAQMNVRSGVDQEVQPKMKAYKSVDTSGQSTDQTLLGVFSEARLVHEVLRRNRGYLEMTIPIDVIITTLEAQDVLLQYELHQVKSHASLTEKNRSFLGSLMRKSPDMFYKFCSIMEGLSGYEYIGRYLRAEMKDVDPTVPLDEKRQTIPKAVDALVDKELLKKSIQSIVDKQREMAEEVRKVHQTEVSQLKKAVSDARDKVSDVKEECNKIIKKLDEEKLGSSEQLVTFQGQIAEIVKICEDVQIQQKEDDRSILVNMIAAMKLQSRIGELTTLLEEKEQEIAGWKGSAERMEIRYSEVESQRSLVIDKLAQRDQELAESKVRYDRQREKYEKMIENMGKEIKDLENEKSTLTRCMDENQWRTKLSHYMDENQSLRKEKNQLLAKIDPESWSQPPPECLETISKTPQRKRKNEAQTVISDLDFHFDTAVESIGKEELAIEILLKTSISNNWFHVFRCWLSELLQKLFDRCVEIYLNSVEAAARCMQSKRKDEIVIYLSKSDLGFPQRVKYLFRGLLTVGHQRTQEEEWQAALLYPEIEVELKKVNKGDIDSKAKEEMAMFVMSKGLSGPEAQLLKPVLSDFAHQAIEHCWALLTACYNPPVFDSSDCGAFYDVSLHDDYEIQPGRQLDSGKRRIIGYVFPGVFLINDESTELLQRGKVLLS